MQRSVFRYLLPITMVQTTTPRSAPVPTPPFLIRFVVIEYVMLRGVNDTAEDAARLAILLSDVYCMINLIVFNPHDGTQFEKSDEADVRHFRSVLAASGKVCTVRVSKGDDTMAACGQLGDPGSSPRPAPMLQPPERLRAALQAATAAGGGAREGAATSAGAEGGEGCGCNSS